MPGPWHEDDLAGRLLETDRALPEEQQEWRIISLPAQAVDEHDPLSRGPGEWLASARRRTLEQWESIKRSVGARTASAKHPICAASSSPSTPPAASTTSPGSSPPAAAPTAAPTSSRTGPAGTPPGLWRQAWFTVLDLETDVLVYENNLVDPVMRKAIPAAWRRMREQARALQAAGLLDVGPDDVDETICQQRLTTAVRSLGGTRRRRRGRRQRRADRADRPARRAAAVRAADRRRPRCRSRSG